ISLFQETLELQKVILRLDHPDTLTTMNNLAMAYKENGQLIQAVSLFEETLAKWKTIGPDHPNTLAIMRNLGNAYAEARQGEKAAAVLIAFVDQTRKRAPKDSPQFAGLLAEVSVALLGCGQHASAEPLLRECLAIREKNIPDAWATFNAKS